MSDDWYEGWKPAKKWNQTRPGAFYLYYINDHECKTSFFAGIVEKGADKADVRWYASVWIRPIPRGPQDMSTKFFWTAKEAKEWVEERLKEKR